MAKKKAVSFKKIARSVTGISTPIFGVSWTPPKDERKIVQKLVVLLEDRRALYYEQHMEYSPWVTESVLEIRKELTDALQQCDEESEMVGPIRAMRAACRKYLDKMGHPGQLIRGPWPREILMWEALGELRGVFGVHLARLCTAYGIDVAPELASIFPASEDEKDNE